MIVCIDGNDGTGKSTIISLLKEKFPTITFQDRGYPSWLTFEKGSFAPADLYIILVCPVEVSLDRLQKSGKNMEEFWHLPLTLIFFDQKFKQLSVENNWPVVCSDDTLESVVSQVGDIIQNSLKGAKNDE